MHVPTVEVEFIQQLTKKKVDEYTKKSTTFHENFYILLVMGKFCSFIALES